MDLRRQNIGEGMEFNHDLLIVHCYLAVLKRGLNMRLLACAVAAVSMLAGGAQAGDWRMMIAKDGAYAWVQESDIRGTQIKTAWVSIVYSKSTPATGSVDIVLTKVEFDCEGGELRNLSLSAQMIDGTNVYIDNTVTPWGYVAPESFAEYWMKAICFNEYIIESPIRAASIYDAARRLRAMEN